jgi:polygalacturonase
MNKRILKGINSGRVIRLHSFCLLIISIFAVMGCTQGASTTNRNDLTEEIQGWKLADKILSEIHEPVFPDRIFLIRDYGAKADGTTDCTAAIRSAVDDCSSKGGGRVVVPEGEFITGPIHLKSNVNLHISKGAILLFSTDPADYLPMVYTRWEGVELMNYSPLIYAFKQKNIAVTGRGTLDGRAATSNWWAWKGTKNFGWQEGMPNQKDGRDRLIEMSVKGVPVEERLFGEGHYLRPPFIQSYKCERVLIEGVTVKNSPFWVLHPVLSNNVIIKGVTIESLGPNSDGCDPESCRNVLIQNCNFNSGDDCIAIKSGRNEDGRRINVPSENIIIQNCTMANGHGGVVIGSEISGNVRNVFAENCVMDSPNLQRALRIKTNSLRGGTVENIYLRDIKVGQVRDQVVRINMFYQGETGPYLPVVRNVHVSTLNVRNGGKTGILLEGIPESPIQEIFLNNVTIKEVAKPFEFKNVKDIHFENVEINGSKIDSVFFETN